MRNKVLRSVANGARDAYYSFQSCHLIIMREKGKMNQQ